MKSENNLEELDMSFKEWRKVKLEDAVEFNPTERLKKGVVAKKVAMECLTPFTRKVSNYEVTEFKGGTKFRNGDTLLARITPCLENGKTAYVDLLDKDEIGFGSTEYIVLREKYKITDSKFIYYLSISPQFREVAIKSMNGSSGRQRVQNDVLKNTEILLPSLEEQKAIADILSSLDDKIELNNEMNETLEEMAQTLFKRWFVDFEFPNEEGQPYKSSGGEMVESELGMIPKGWKVKKIQDVSVSANTGADAIRRAPIVEHDTGIKCVRVGDFTNKRNYDAWGFCQITEEDYKKFQLKENDILITRTASIGLIKFVLEDINAVFNNGIIRLRVFDEIAMYVNATLNSVDFTNHINKITGETSTRPNMKVNYVLNYKFVVPNEKINNHFINIYSKILRKIDYISKENQQLALIRDTLLPKLMSGEIRVSDFES